ncbi:MAG: hypothetical protein K0Q59_5753 [Paenibacillus sp.]|nr:hypothetical protein [Paenibacillus sp.]
MSNSLFSVDKNGTISVEKKRIVDRSRPRGDIPCDAYLADKSLCVADGGF